MSETQSGLRHVKWLVMLYIASDDKPDADPGNTLTDECGTMLRRLEESSIDRRDIAIVALTDSPFDAKEAEEKDKKLEKKTYSYMTPALRELQDTGWQKIEQEAPEQVVRRTNGEPKIDSGDYRTLAAFIQWAVRRVQADHTMLAIIGHGGGWSPGFYEVEPELFPKIEQAMPADRVVASDSETKQPDQHSDINRMRELQIRRLIARRATLLAQGNKGGNSSRARARGQRMSHPQLPAQTDKGGNSSPYPGLCPDYSGVTETTPPPTISTRGLGVALEQGIGGQPRKKLDVLFLDACLMSMVEVAYEIKDSARYLVAGEDLLFARLPYHHYLQNLTSQTPENLAESIVQSYNDPDSDLVQRSWTVAATDLTKLPKLRDAINALAEALLQVIKQEFDLQFVIFEAYDRSQKFDYDADQDIDQKREGYVDLFDFADQLHKLLENPERYRGKPDIEASILKVRACAEQLKQLLGGDIQPQQTIRDTLLGVFETSTLSSEHAVVYSRSQTDQDGKRNLFRAYGLSIYLPLGEPDDRHKELPVDLGPPGPRIEKFFHGETYLTLYGKQLRFTDEHDNADPQNRIPTAWARLVLDLMRLRFPNDTWRRDRFERPYRAPRQGRV